MRELAQKQFGEITINIIEAANVNNKNAVLVEESKGLFSAKRWRELHTDAYGRYFNIRSEKHYLKEFRYSTTVLSKAVFAA